MEKTFTKTDRMRCLDKLLRVGCTIKDIGLTDEFSDLSDRSIREYLSKFEKGGAVFSQDYYNGRERIWKYEDTNYSYFDQPSKDLEKIRQKIESLQEFKDVPSYQLLRYNLICLMKGLKSDDINAVSFDENKNVKGLKYFSKIVDAIIRRDPLKVQYHEFEEKEKKYNIHPIHLREYNNRWYVFAYVEGEDRIFNLPLDRINEVNKLSKKYINVDFDPEEYFEDIVGITNYVDEPVLKVVFRVRNNSKSTYYIRTKPIHDSQKELKGKNTEDYTYFQIDVKQNYELKSILFSFHDAIEVVEPASLRAEFAKIIRNMNDMYNNKENAID
ncbi:MAG: WYL domain-containing protein [Bacteroidales bacterium]|nr:WYL domain-containing protein [Bacteroidales bacterium]